MKDELMLRLIQNFLKQDMSAFAIIYKEFEALMILYSNRLGGEDYLQELTVFLLELLYGINIYEFENSEQIKRYIAVSIRNKYIALSKDKQKYENFHCNSTENVFYCNSTAEDTVDMTDMLKSLSARQRVIIVYKYIYGYSDIELALLLGISRQAVNRLKNRAVETMQEYYFGERNKGNVREQ